VDDARHVFRLYETFAKGRKKTWRDDIAMARRHLLPVWGPMPLRAIMRAHVHELLDTLVAKGLTTGVNRVQAVISRLFTDTLDRSLVDAHPAARMIKRFKEQPSERVLTDDELRALWTTLDAHLGAPADAIRLRLLLGQRGGEVIYSVAITGDRGLVTIQNGGGSIVLELRPDGTLAGSGPVQVNGRVIAGQNANGDLVFQPKTDTCTIGTLTPVRSQ
jgi:hypothetical protein